MQGNWLALVNKNANVSVDKFKAIFLIIWLGNISVNTRKMVSPSQIEFYHLLLHVSVLMGPSSGSVYNKYDTVN
jgi:hypothetical protein